MTADHTLPAVIGNAQSQLVSVRDDCWPHLTSYDRVSQQNNRLTLSGVMSLMKGW